MCYCNFCAMQWVCQPNGVPSHRIENFPAKQCPQRATVRVHQAPMAPMFCFVTATCCLSTCAPMPSPLAHVLTP